jgi:hypothetical protein
VTTEYADLISALRAVLPPIFREIDSGKLSGGVLSPGTLANCRSSGEIPAHCYTYDAAGCTVLMRDPFLDDFYAHRLARAVKRGPFQKKAKAPIAKRSPKRRPSAGARPASNDACAG